MREAVMRVLNAVVVVLCSCVFFSTKAVPDSKEFPAPNIDGVRLEWCLHWSKDCGKPASDAFCREQGFDEAAKFVIDSKAGSRGIKTIVRGEGRVC
jgi:hypothetical protein